MRSSEWEVVALESKMSSPELHAHHTQNACPAAVSSAWLTQNPKKEGASTVVRTSPDRRLPCDYHSIAPGLLIRVPEMGPSLSNNLVI